MGAEQTPRVRRWMRTGIAVVLSVKLAGLLPLVALAVGGGEGAGQSGAGAAVPVAAHAGSRSGATPASSAASKSPPPSSTASKAPPAAPGAAHIPGDGPSTEFAAESRGVRELVEVLRKRDEELERRDAELARREATIATAAKDLNEKIVHLEALTGSTPSTAPPAPVAASPSQAGAGLPAVAVTGAAGVTGTAMEELGRIYGAMKGEEAAPLFDRLDDATVLRIFQHMKQRQISAVLPLMKPEKAVTLTELLGGRKPLAVEARPAGDSRASAR